MNDFSPPKMEEKNSTEEKSIEEKNSTDEKKPGFWQIVFSTLAAFIGVQSNKNRERDFKHGSIGVYIAAGIIFVVIFIAVVITLVKLVLSNLT